MGGRGCWARSHLFEGGNLLPRALFGGSWCPLGGVQGTRYVWLSGSGRPLGWGKRGGLELGMGVCLAYNLASVTALVRVPILDASCLGQKK